MGQAIGQSLPFAVAVALSAGAIILEVLLLGTPRGRATGPAFLVGRALAIAAAGAVFLAIARPSNASDHGQPATWVDWLKLILGALLLLAAVHQWRSRKKGDDHAAMPKWMGALDRFTPLKAAGLGIALVVINLKNLFLVIGAAAAVAQTGISTGSEVVAWAVFTLVASIGAAAPVVVYLAAGARAASMLDGMRSWLVRNNIVIMTVISLIFGAKMIGDAITGFSS